MRVASQAAERNASGSSFSCVFETLAWATTRGHNGRMDKTVRVFRSLEEMKTAEYDDWRERPPHERMRAVKEITLATYQMKEPTSDVRRLQITLVRLPRPQR